MCAIQEGHIIIIFNHFVLTIRNDEVDLLGVTVQRGTLVSGQRIARVDDLGQGISCKHGLARK